MPTSTGENPTQLDEAQWIVTEFLRTDDAQLRRNATVALVAMGQETGLREVARVALTDGEDVVREQAEDALASLPKDRLDPVAAEFDRALDAPKTAPRAYDALARLRAKGAVLPLRDRSAWARMALAASATRAISPLRQLGETFQHLTPSLMGGVVGIIVFGGLIAMSVGIEAIADQWSVAAAILGLAALLTLASAWRARPGYLHHDKAAGGAVELTRAFLGATAVSLPLAWSTGTDSRLAGLAGVVGLAALLAFGVTAVRAAALAVALYGGPSLRSRSALTAISALCGVAVALTFAALDLRLRPLVETSAAPTLWLTATAAMFGAALAFARFEAPPRGGAQRSRLPARLAAAVAAATAVALVVGAVRIRPASRAQHDAILNPQPLRPRGSAAARILDSLTRSARIVRPPALDTLSTLPGYVAFGLSARSAIEIQYEGNRDVMIEVWDATGRLYKSWDDTAEPTCPLPPGLYVVEVLHFPGREMPSEASQACDNPGEAVTATTGSTGNATALPAAAGDSSADVRPTPDPAAGGSGQSESKSTHTPGFELQHWIPWMLLVTGAASDTRVSSMWLDRTSTDAVTPGRVAAYTIRIGVSSRPARPAP